jgi:hypothetical protein
MESTNRPPLGECRRARKNSNAFLGNSNFEHLLHFDIGYRSPVDDDSFIANLSKKANTIFLKFLFVEFQSSWHFACVMCVMCVMCDDVFVGDEPRASWPSRGLRRVPPFRLAVSG